jgi:[ribosomal protein S5]-alanine N-acetyltransferase
LTASETAASGVLTPPPVLTTERLIIRPLESDDLEAVHRLYLDIGWDVRALNPEENRERRGSWLKWTLASYREFPRLQQPVYGERAIARRADGAFVGLIGLVPSLGPFAQLPSLGAKRHARFSPEAGLFWAVSPAFQRQGLATEAARAFLAHIVSTLNLARVVATTEHDNHPSIAVMRRLDMRIESNPYPEDGPDWFQVVGIYEPEGAETGPIYAPARDRTRDRP